MNRPVWSRLAAVAVVFGGALIAGVTALLSLFVIPPALVLVLLGLAVLALGGLHPVLAGRWGPGAWVAPQGIGVGLVLVAYTALGLYACEQVREGLLERSVHATPSQEILVWTGLAVLSVLAVVGLLAVLPLRLTRRARVAMVSLVALTGVAGAGTAVAVAAGGDPCDGFRFDRDAWRSEDSRERVGAALVRCGTLRGMHRDEVDELLGGRFVNSPQRSYTLSEDEDWLGWPSFRTLVVTYGDDKRVRSAALGYSRG